MNMKELIVKTLKENGFSGLCDTENGCGCGIDDIAPCGSDCNVLNCQPAYLIKCKGKNCETPCDGYDEDGNGTCYTIEKPEETPK